MAEGRDIMELTNVEIKVPKEMIIYMNAHNPEVELERNALILYPYIKNMTISHGRAAEILGIEKWRLITLYNNLGLAYINMDLSEIEEELKTYNDLRGVLV